MKNLKIKTMKYNFTGSGFTMFPNIISQNFILIEYTELAVIGFIQSISNDNIFNNQSELYTKMGISKASYYRAIKSLQRKNVITITEDEFIRYKLNLQPLIDMFENKTAFTLENSNTPSTSTVESSVPTSTNEITADSKEVIKPVEVLPTKPIEVLPEPVKEVVQPVAKPIEEPIVVEVVQQVKSKFYDDGSNECVQNFIKSQPVPEPVIEIVQPVKTVEIYNVVDNQVIPSTQPKPLYQPIAEPFLGCGYKSLYINDKEHFMKINSHYQYFLTLNGINKSISRNQFEIFFFYYINMFYLKVEKDLVFTWNITRNDDNKFEVICAYISNHVKESIKDFLNNISEFENTLLPYQLVA